MPRPLRRRNAKENLRAALQHPNASEMEKAIEWIVYGNGLKPFLGLLIVTVTVIALIGYMLSR